MVDNAFGQVNKMAKDMGLAQVFSKTKQDAVVKQWEEPPAAPGERCWSRNSREEEMKCYMTSQMAQDVVGGLPPADELLAK